MQIVYKPARRIYGKTKGKIQTQSKVPPIDFHAKTGLAVEYSISGNMTQASTQEYSITDIPPIDFQSDGSGLSDYSIYGNMVQASSQQYSLTGTSPLSFKSDANTLTAWSVSGAMAQTGTPVPSAPITPEFCGERTNNLAPPLAQWVDGYASNSDGTILPASPILKEKTSDFIDISELETITFSYENADGFPSEGQNSAWRAIAFYTENKVFIQRKAAGGSESYSPEIPASTKYVRLSFRSFGHTTNTMLNSGSTALPYEPFGYKIPITNGGQTVTAYLAEPIRKIGDYADLVDSSGVVTRNIKKLILTGEETAWGESTQTGGGRRRVFLSFGATNLANSFYASSHFSINAPNTGYPDIDKMSINTGGSIIFGVSLDETKENFKQWLKDQYAAGTPVTVWYVLATPTTEQITAPTIPTTSGDNTLSIDTTLSPSSVSITTTSGVWTENPIIPEEVGERTGNLLEYYIDGIIISTGAIESSGAYVTYCAQVTVGEIYTVSSNCDVYGYYAAKPAIGTTSVDGTRHFPYAYNYNITIPDGVKWLGVRCRVENMPMMLNSGSTALPYEPYGYKIPVTNAGTTTNIYTLEPLRKIGDYADVVGSTDVVTRQIAKFVFDGTENWQSSASGENTFLYYKPTITPRAWSVCICSHMTQQNISSTTTMTGTMIDQSSQVRMRVEGITTTNAFKTYLAQQYSNGTPVTIWYALSAPTTETITSPTISTLSGANTLSIGTTLQPSNVSFTTSSSVYPLNPIITEEVGDRTGNLFDGQMEQGTLTSSGIESDAPNRIRCADFITLPAGNYTISASSTLAGEIRVFGFVYDLNGQFEERIPSDWTQQPFSFTLPTKKKFRFVMCIISEAQPINITPTDIDSIMLNSGSTALPFEPYGYKIPLNLNNTISNIYLSQPIRKIGNYSDNIDYENGTVTRNIKKLVLTGEEGWTATSDTNRTRCYKGKAVTAGDGNGYVCTHYGADVYNTSYPIAGKMSINSLGTLIFGVNNGTTADDFKTYLTTQYANGNPVTVYYVLSTPEVEQITPPTITPSIESNTISVDTTLQPSNLSITYTSPDYSEIKLVYDNQGNILYNDPPYHDWGAVRWIVRQGLGPQYYPIGYIFYDNFNPETGTAYQVVAHNHHFDPNLTALGYTYSMTCLEVKLNDYMVFDNAEAFLYTDTIIPAGTYRFTIPNYDATYGGNKTYYFTSTADLPAGSQIVMNWQYNQLPKTVTAYSPSGTTMVQTITTATTGWNGLTLTEYVEGTSPTATDLGTIAGPTTQLGTSNYGQMNHIHRARYGSNNYLQSGIRQYLNSNSAANTWWQPQTIFDRPYGGRTFAGKLTKLNQNLVDVLATPTIQSRTNSYFETTSLDGTTFSLSTNYDITTDKLFLLSPMEINFSTTDTTVGTVLDYYANATNADRIKIRTSTGAAGYWWLRTPYPSRAYYVRGVFTSGALTSTYAYNSIGSAAAWVIQ